MDPNETLRLIASIAGSIHEAASRPGVSVHVPSFEADANDLAGHVADLVEWLGHGGFLPDNWVRSEA